MQLSDMQCLDDTSLSEYIILEILPFKKYIQQQYFILHYTIL